jgi:hypothetical protein
MGLPLQINIDQSTLLHSHSRPIMAKMLQRKAHTNPSVKKSGRRGKGLGELARRPGRHGKFCSLRMGQKINMFNMRLYAGGRLATNCKMAGCRLSGAT